MEKEEGKERKKKKREVRHGEEIIKTNSSSKPKFIIRYYMKQNDYLL